MLTLDGNVMRMKQLDDARRGAGQRPRGTHDELSEVHRVQAIDVLGRINGKQDPLLIHPCRQGKLHEDRSHLPVGIHLGHRRHDIVLGGLDAETDMAGLDAHLLTVGVLHGDILGTRAVIAYQDGGQGDAATHGLESGYTVAHLHLEAAGDLLSVEELCCHLIDPSLWGDSVVRPSGGSGARRCGPW